MDNKVVGRSSSLPSLHLSKVFYQKYIEKQYDDDLDKMARGVADGDSVYHKEEENADFYREKRDFLSKDTLKTL